MPFKKASPPTRRFLTLSFSTTQTTQEWDNLAHLKIKLTSHQFAVQAFVLKWRKLELKSWNSLLDAIETKMRSIAPKWWFLVHDAVEECVKNAVPASADGEEAATTVATEEGLF